MLTGKSIIVTGAGSGIGRTTSQMLAAAGAAVLVVDIDLANAMETARDIERAGGRARALCVDVTSESAVADMIAYALAEFGRLDGAFNNAGLSTVGKPIHQLDLADWNRTMAVNLTGVFLCMKHEISAMATSGGGAIVNAASANGVIGNPCTAEYTASKHGVIGLTRSGAAEAGTTGVRVNAVLPGLTMTPMIAALANDPSFQKLTEAGRERHSIGRFGQPEDVGETVKWLLSDHAKFINGANVPVDGGYTAR